MYTEKYIFFLQVFIFDDRAIEFNLSNNVQYIYDIIIVKIKTLP